MKIISIFCLFVAASSLSAAPDGKVSSHNSHAKKPTSLHRSKSSPPKAQVIEEDDPAGVPLAHPGEDKKVSKVDNQASLSSEGSESGKMTQAQGGMPPLSELTPLTPDVEKPANEGIQIEVEKVTGSKGFNHKGGAVKVTSPWPAKPLDTPPVGWKYVPAPAGIEPFRTTVKLGGGRSINLAITPYVLVPISDGLNSIRILEPGYKPALRNQQVETVGSVLLDASRELEQNEKRASAAIQRLQELLSSLPKT